MFCFLLDILVHCLLFILSCYFFFQFSISNLKKKKKKKECFKREWENHARQSREITPASVRLFSVLHLLWLFFTEHSAPLLVYSILWQVSQQEKINSLTFLEMGQERENIASILASDFFLFSLNKKHFLLWQHCRIWKTACSVWGQTIEGDTGRHKRKIRPGIGSGCLSRVGGVL